MLPDMSQLCLTNDAHGEKQNQQPSIDVLTRDLWGVVEEQMHVLISEDESDVYKVSVAFGIFASGPTNASQGLHIDFRDIFPYGYGSDDLKSTTYDYAGHPMNSTVDQHGPESTSVEGGRRDLAKHVVIQRLREAIQKAFRQTATGQEQFELTFSPEGPLDKRFNKQGDPYGSLPWDWILNTKNVDPKDKEKWLWYEDADVMGPQIAEFHKKTQAVAGGSSVRIEMRSKNAKDAALEKPPTLPYLEQVRLGYSSGTHTEVRSCDLRISILEPSWMFDKLAGESATDKEVDENLIAFVKTLSDLVLGTPNEAGLLTPRWVTFEVEHGPLFGYSQYNQLFSLTEVSPVKGFLYKMVRKYELPYHILDQMDSQSIRNHEDEHSGKLAGTL